ncbi:uncharacterized protein VTP21DRAFT_2056 [Calcarisporiella thermophila]|uniref:uncharacterized protein n=1 Tax=Calcarisporiella thermophila TaxID=911321 RepID=UPI0037434E13
MPRLDSPLTNATQATRVRVFASDLDGTLVHSNKTVSRRAVNALSRLGELGVKIILCTGRPPRNVHKVTDVVPVNAPVLCSNGAIIYDPYTQTVLERRDIDQESARHIIKLLIASFPTALFSAESGTCYRAEQRYYDMRQDHFPPTVPVQVVPTALDLVSNDTPGKITLLVPGLTAEEMYEQMPKELLAEGSPCKVTFSGEDYVEFSAPGVCKGSTLAAYCEKLGVPREAVVSVGDNHNDIEMIQWAGRGYAMGNAHQSLKQIAAYTTATNDEDGVAQLVEKLIEEIESSQ